MISITPLAQEKLSGYLAENKVEPKVRVYLPDCGCSGPSQIALALDRPEDGDVTAQAGDLELFMSRELYEMVGKVSIDFKDDGNDSGFVVYSEKPVKQAEPSASGCAGCSCCG